MNYYDHYLTTYLYSEATKISNNLQTISSNTTNMFHEIARKEEIDAVNKKYDKQNELDRIQNKIREHTNSIYELQKRERELKGEKTEWWRN